jgi:hypothetical protein
MLLQTNSYIVPKDKRGEHARLMRRFRQTLQRLGCDQFEVYEQVGANWTGVEISGRFVQIMRFRDLKHQHAVQAAERNDPTAQALISEFCELVNFSYQQQQGLFAVGFYQGVLQTTVARLNPPDSAEADEAPKEPTADQAAVDVAAEGTEPTQSEPPEEIEQPKENEPPAPAEHPGDNLSGTATEPAAQIPAAQPLQGDLDGMEFGDDPNGEEAA